MYKNANDYLFVGQPKIKRILGVYLSNPAYWLAKLRKIIPKNPLTKKSWQRNIDVFSSYVDSDEKMIQIANKYNISVERVSQIVERVLRRVNYLYNLEKKQVQIKKI